ncbi:hypothetical protein EHS25_004519 [Saitozyma podzolica]|uniref:Metallo-beta-lactamase domain-containing protein n=1 Tax=Saitozyma podzolica TaxID=1890683 RepID=A0A427YU98_9TREE|nr:hypothetical protein EHS25_004519 [Saitozyma podzolica]
MRLTPVDKLEFLVLVDNCIEWFSALPPGFVHEVPQHLKRPPPNEPPKDPLTGLPVLDFANYCCGAHGLSILIMTTIGDKTYQVLMDGGPEHLTIERNVKAMAVELKDLDAIVLSHWHSDHSGGILKALELRQSSSSSSSFSSSSNSLGPLDTLDPLNALPVDLHPERPIRRGICNVLTDAQTTYDRPIHMVVGGLHLVPTAQQPVVETVDFLSRRLRPSPKYVLPLHCTGLEARAMLRQAMGDACITAGVGMRVTVDAKAEEELDADDELQILD